MLNRRTRAFTAGYISLVLLFSLGAFLSNKDVFLLITNQLTILSFVGSLALCMVIFVITSFETAYLARVQTGKKMDSFDTLTLSVAGAFWGYLLPVKGGVAYLFFLMKKKYGIRFAQGAGLVMVSYLLTLVLVGCTGLWAFTRSISFSWVGVTVSISLVMSPAILYVFQQIIFIRRRLSEGRFLQIFHDALDDMIQVMTSSLFQRRVLGILLFLQLARIFLRWAWYALLLNVLSIETSLGYALVLTLVAEIANIFTIIPGNIGINEGLSALVFSFFGHSMAYGVLIEMIIRISAILLAFTVGFWAVLYNAHKLGIKGIRLLGQEVAKEARVILG